MLPMTVEYKGEDWWVVDDTLLNIKTRQLITFDELDEYAIDYIAEQLDERREELDTIDLELMESIERNWKNISTNQNTITKGVTQ